MKEYTSSIHIQKILLQCKYGITNRVVESSVAFYSFNTTVTLPIITASTNTSNASAHRLCAAASRFFFFLLSRSLMVCKASSLSLTALAISICCWLMLSEPINNWISFTARTTCFIASLTVAVALNYKRLCCVAMLRVEKQNREKESVGWRLLMRWQTKATERHFHCSCRSAKSECVSLVQLQ